MKKINIALILCSILLIFSCFSTQIEDRYKPFPGTATIVEIKDSRYNPGGNHMYSDIFYNFEPDNKNAKAGYRYKKWPDRHVQLSCKSRMNLYKPWIKKMNIKEGNVYRAVRYEKFSSWGSSAPVIFRVDLAKELSGQ